ncbi:putative Ig domain-containing protein [Mariniblastus fucicola]|uniref:Putative deoxyribonuclease RhsA n=1 Tax=Mariniblastus fucicola TaxID=980251 RepID=A0A5B9P8S2_9BACT|nr:putative Ig domain-containing protein [Mariniblastus fucicola]QEG23137.1 putative deoxyribonuclease RhsA [Mariniblastus fucicola]
MHNKDRVKKLLAGVLGRVKQKNSSRSESQTTNLQIEQLEPRMMLNGDAQEVLFSAGFEDADVGAGQYAFFNSVSGFTATKRSVEVQNNHPAVGPASEGQKHLELDGRNGIFVNIEDVQAASLSLELDYSPRAGASVAENEIEVLWQGDVIRTLSGDGSASSTTQFRAIDIDLPITNGSTAGRLEFRSKASGGRGMGGLIDDVIVTATLSPIAIENISDQEVQRESTLSVDADLLPPDDSAEVRFELVKAPVGATVNTQTGQFNWLASDANIQATENRESQTTIGPKQLVLFAGFEDVDVASGQFGFFDRVSGFDATARKVEVQHNHPAVGPASQANQHVELDGRNGIARSMDTVVGDLYELKFDFSPRAGADSVANAIEVLWDGKVIHEVTADGRNNSSTSFRTVTVDLSEFSGDTTRLEFRSKAPGSVPGMGGLIDNVRVTRQEVSTSSSDNPFEVIIRATDDQGRSDTEQFNITITDQPSMAAPVFDPIENLTIDELGSVSFQLTATDADTPTNELRYEAVRIPINATLNPATGQFQWTSDEFSGGYFFNVDVKVVDTDGLSDQKRFRITVNEVNRGPSIEAIDDFEIESDSTMVVASKASDPDRPRDTLSWSLTESPDGARINGQGVISWTPTQQQAESSGPFRFTVQVSDGNGGIASESFDVSIDDRSPVLDFIENRTIDELTPVSIQLSATDPNGNDEDLIFELIRGPVGSTLDPDTGVFAWTPNEWAGAVDFFNIDVQVRDAEGLTDSQRFRIFVNETNVIPVLEEIDDFSIEPGQDVSVQAMASDSDVPVDTLTFSLSNAPDGATVSDEGLIHWTPPTPLFDGTFAFTVTVNDGNGGSASESFNVTIGQATDSLTLVENDDFLVTQSREFIVGPDTQSVSFNFSTQFDKSDQFVNDAFEVALVDVNGQPLVQTFNRNRDAFFNLTEDEAASVGVNAIQSGDVLSVDLSHLEEGTVAKLIFRLVNNDSDTQTRVEINNIETSSSGLNTPIGASFNEVRALDAAPDFTLLQDVTESFAARFGRTSFNEDTNALFTNIALTNVGQVAVSGRMVAAIKNISDEQIQLIQPDGRLPDGRFYIDVTSDSGQVAPGQMARTRDFQWLNEDAEAFQFELSLLAEVNSAPTGFTSSPPAVVEAGNTLNYKAVATDPDEGQPLRYSIVRGDEAVSIDETSGELSWTTNTDDLGNHGITIRATDPFGLYSEQSFDIEVVDSLQNRPPVFTSDPVTEATASSGFEITTFATGDNPNGVTVIEGFQGPRIVTTNEADQTIGVYAGQNNDRFDDATEYSTGFPTTNGELVDVGYAIDLGLPELLTTYDSNSVESMDQGDLNGDGILDFVVMTTYDSFSTGERYQLVIHAMLGDGDGGFASPEEVYRHSYSTYTFDTRNLLLRDLNNDGDLDIVTSEVASDQRLISMLGNGDGTFQTAVEAPYTTEPFLQFVAADVDEDGVLDLIGRRGTLSLGGAQYELAWSKGLGDGTFAESTFILDAEGTYNANPGRGFEVTDLNADGHLDVAFLGSTNLHIYHSDGLGNFTLATEFRPSVVSPDLWIRGGDFNGDGFADLLYNNGWNGEFILLSGDGSGIDFGSEVVNDVDSTIANYAGSDSPVDIDGDGDLDLIFGVANSDYVSPRVALNDGTGKFTITEYPMVDFSQTASQLRFEKRDVVRGAMFGDYNLDGVMDFSYFTQGGDTNGVGVRLGTRPGEFGSTRAISWDTSRANPDATPGDFNGDGNVDLVDVYNDQIHLGRGDGTFEDPFPALGFFASGFVSVSDFNLDGLDDIVGARSNRYFVALSNGDGTFTTSDDQLAEGSFYGYSSTIAADFNADGYPDFVAKTGVERQIDVHLNDPENPGVFTRSFRYTLPDGSQGINVSNWQESYATADFTGDGILDLSFAERDDYNNGVIKLVVMAGDGNGDFTFHSELEGFDSYSQNLPAHYYAPGDFNAGDIDGDGDEDLIAVTNYGARIFLNDGSGNFEFFTHLDSPGTQQRGRDSWLVDFDQDGQLDLIQTGLVGYGPLVIRLGNGDASFQAPQTYGLIGSVQGIISRQPFADLDGDGQLDFVYGSDNVGNYRNDSASVYAGRRNDLVDLLSVDLDGDGNQELLAVQEQMDRLQIFQGDNLGGLTRLPDLQTGRAPQAVTVADLNGDGVVELLVANRASQSITVYTGDLDAGYASTEVFVGGGLIDIKAADVNGDGFDDVFALDVQRGGLLKFISDGSLTLTSPIEVALGDTPEHLTLADTNNDGTIDALITLPESNRLMILDDIATDSGPAPLFLEFATSPGEVVVLELNEDGNPDIAVTLPESNAVSVHYGRGDNQYAAPQLIEVGEAPEKITVADADEDSRLDLIVANSGDNTASVIYNRFDPNEVYSYDADAIDPDNDAVSYRIVDGPGGLFIDSQTGEVTWAASPNQVGGHTVTIEASDGRGGIATQTYRIEVEPARENNTPLIATEPVAKIGAGESFEYQAAAVDADNDALRYRILSGPDGATVDPVTGLVRWDGRIDGTAFLSPDGTAVNHGDIVTPVGEDSSIALNTLTVEGWFKPENLTVAGGAATLFRYGSLLSEPFHVRFRYNSELELFLDQDGTTTQSISRIPFDVEVDRWYHIALSVDDSNQTFELFVDGKSAISGNLPSSFVYDESMKLEIGGNYWDFSGQVDNFRIWNTARTAEQIREGMTRQFDGDANLMLDYRFEVEGAQTVRDNTPYRNDGYLTPNVGTPEIVDGGLAEFGTYSFVIGVEDGRGGISTQAFDVEIVPELRGAIEGNIFDDANGDGIRNDGAGTEPAEDGLGEWLVFIDANDNQFADPEEVQTVTDANGNYRLAGLLPDTYPVRFAPMAGFESVSPRNVEVNASETTIANVAAMQSPLGQIQGQIRTIDGETAGHWTAYVDMNDNGVRDEAEPIANSDRLGNFAITGLAAGTYILRADLPAGWLAADGFDGVEVELLEDAIAAGNDLALEPSNSSVTGGVRFVTTAPQSVRARDVFQYASVATNINGAPIQYDLSLAPEGLTIDPENGRVTWQPTIGQAGQHSVILRATDASGSISLQSFTIEVVAPNTAPAITSTPPASGFIGKTFVYQVHAQDGELDSLTFMLAAAPASVNMDAEGLIEWTPDASGEADFEILVVDSAGNDFRQTFTVDVSGDNPSVTPFTIEPARKSIGLGQTYLSKIAGEDSLGRPLSWTLVSGPAGFEVAADGMLKWTANSIGNEAIELLATTVDGESESYTFNLEVIGYPVINTPSIVSEPTLSATIGNAYAYDVEVANVVGELLTFTIVDGLIGASIDPDRGTLRWTPESDQLGESDFTIEVVNANGESTFQEFTVSVTRFGGPPRIVSTPPTEANVGGSFLYTIDAVDTEGDPLTYRLLQAPAGMSINETTGEFSWTPTAGQVGLRRTVIEVADGIGGATTQAFAILVGDGVVNLAPDFSSEAPRFTAVGSNYTYQLEATDAEGTELSYAVSRGPTGLTISDSGLVSWTPADGQDGKFVVTLRVTDEGGASSIESFELDVLAENRAPVVNSSAPTTSVKGVAFRYDLLVNDADIDPLAFALLAAPEGAEINAFGQIVWQTDDADLGDHQFAVEVTDPRGGIATQSFTLNLVADTEGPKVSLIENLGESSRNVLPWQGPFVVYARAIDNVGLASLTLSANGQDIPLSANGTAVFTFEDWLFESINVTATAVDTSGNVTTKSISFDYDVPEGWSTNPGPEVPTAIITSPADSGTATGFVSIVGTADHEDFGAYVLSYRSVDESSFTEITRSTDAVASGELGVWDTSMLRNGEYVIRLQVATTEGAANVVEHRVGVSGELKLGNFQLEFTDMVIPIAGIPIEITRVYDTLDADVEGDFGYGWRLEFRDTDLQVGLPKSGLEDIGIYPALRPGTKIYLNIPGEGRQGFTFNPDIQVLPGFGGNNLVLARPRFTPDPRVTATLSPGTSGYLQVNELGELYAPGGIPYNPASPDFGGAYLLTTREGITYRINGADGKLESATDRNGNVTEFSTAGIVGEGSEEVRFERDARGRIVSITDPAGNRLQYSYNDSGDLERVVDREGNKTEYSYNSNNSHYLESVVDPLGRTGTRAQYDAEGQLTSAIDLNGRSIEFTREPGSSIQRVVDKNGNEELVEFDNQGRVISQTDGLGNTRRFEYGPNGFLARQTDELGHVTTYTYSARGDLLYSTNALGATSRYSYNEFGQIMSITDAVGDTQTMEYDSNGNLIRSVDSQGRVSSNEYDEQGNVILQIDTAGGETRHTYDASGRLAGTTDSNGVTRVFEVDANGNPVGDQVTVVRDGETITLESTLVRDANGNVTENIDALGQTFTQQYNGLGQVTQLTNQTGNSVQFEGTDHSAPEQYVFDDGSSAGYEFDGNGNAVSYVDQEGNVTRYEYNERNELIRIILPDDTPNDDNDNPFQIFEYDSAGRQIASVDALGNRTEYEYNAVGQRIAATDALGERTFWLYDAVGRVVQQTDPLGRTTRFSYNSLGQLVETRFADQTTETRGYDANGNLAVVTNAAGQSTRFVYDSNNLLIKSITSSGFITSYERDEFGNVIRQTDANGHVTSYDFNALSQQTSTSRPLGQNSSIVYDEAGRVLEQTDFNGQTTRFTYDDLGRPVSQEFADGSTLEVTYTHSGLRSTVTDSNGTTRFEYNAAGLIAAQVEPDGTRVDYRYDLAGNLVEIQTPFGSTNYTYDELNRIVSVQSPTDGLTRYTYDPAGRLLATEHANGLIERLSYDSLDRIIEMSVEATDSTIIQQVGFSYDTVGNLVEKIDGNEVTHYQYDAMNRLVGEATSRDGVLTTESFWEYDAVGNLLREVIDGSESLYRYDANDRLIEIFTAGQTETRTYDANGNQLTATTGGQTTEFVWDARGRMVEVSSSVGDSTYEYNADNLRVAIDSDGEQTRFLWTSALGQLPEVIAEYGDGEALQFVYGSGRDEIIVDGEQYSVHSDRLGSTRLITDESGATINEYSYDVWGELLDSTEGIENGYQYTGGYFDEASETTYLRARYLDNDTARFVSVDPFEGRLTDPQSLHRYQYAHQNPLTFVDPTGEVTELAKQMVVLSAKLTLAGIVAAGLQYAWSRAIGGDPVEWQGVTGSASFGATVGYENSFAEAGFTGGFGGAATALISTPFTQSGEDQTSYGAGLVHIFANTGAAIALKADGGAGVGGVSVNTPGAGWIKNLGVYRFGPTYAVLADYNAASGVGRSYGAFLQIGFGSGNAAGLSISTSVGGSINFVGGVTIPIGEGAAGSEAYQQARAFISNFS